MSVDVAPTVEADGETSTAASDGSPDPRRFRPRALVSRRFGGLWVLAIMIVVFSVGAPQTFPTTLTFKLILSDSAVTGLLALGVMLPLVTGVFDLSIANVAGFAMVFASWLNLKYGMGALLVVLITLPASMVFGAVSATLVTRFGVSSFVTTLGVSTVALGVTEQITQGNALEPNFSSGFTKLGQGYALGIPLPFIYVVVLALLLWYLLEHTTLGRRLQAIGGNMEAARLAGVRVGRLQAGVLLASPIIGAFTGIVLATQVGVATDSTTPSLLFPAVAALFLGATQLKEGPNPWGTVLGVIILGTGTKGLQLMGASPAIGDLFSGIVLVVAVAVSGKAGLERLH